MNAPIYLLAKNEWMSFWTFNDQRESDYGSIWYVLKLAKHEVADVNQLNIVIFAGLCLSIAILGLMAPRPPRFAQLAFLVVAAFLLINKVYSPQYVLWLLPLVALARPRLRDWLIWQACECFYWMLVWLHLAQFLAPGNPDQPGPDLLVLGDRADGRHALADAGGGARHPAAGERPGPPGRSGRRPRVTGSSSGAT